MVLHPQRRHGLPALLALAGVESPDRSQLEPALARWAAATGCEQAALYADRGHGCFERVAGDAAFPAELTADAENEMEPGCSRLELAGATLLFRRGSAMRDELVVADSAESRLLAAVLRVEQLSEALREQSLEAKYRGVELEALYDVGLAVVSTLDLDQLTEEILLRAVSLLDARRGALYELTTDGYRLRRAVGGTAAPRVERGCAELDRLLAGDDEASEILLPGADHVLAVTIEGAGAPRGLLAVADKESRVGVGPFSAPDRRTLSLFAHQAGIALENAYLHRQALEKERLEREMELASQIQRQLLPERLPLLDGWELSGWNRPAQQVGGDYYDLLELSGGRLLLVVADVSGKGMPAALLVSNLHSALRLLLDQERLGPRLVERLSRHVLESSLPNKFITLLLVEIEVASGTARYLNAGHNPGLLLAADGRLERLSASGPPVGLLPDPSYAVDRVELGAGSLLCLYSDGITECSDRQGEELGEERLIAFLRDHAGESLERLTLRLADHCRSFADGLAQGDDQTLVMARRR